MDYWLNCLILTIVGALCFYVGYRVGFVTGECDCECCFENDEDGE